MFHKRRLTILFDHLTVFVDTYAKNGAPVITAVAGAWDLRAAQVTGQSNRLHRFLFKIMDEVSSLNLLVSAESKLNFH